MEGWEAKADEQTKIAKPKAKAPSSKLRALEKLQTLTLELVHNAAP